MKKFLLSILLVLSICLSASAQFTTDIIVTSPDGIWTDSRAYVTLNDAITAVGSDERTVKIVSRQTVTTLTVPSNVTLEFARDGSIANSEQLTINTTKITAPNRQIFTGVGNIDFADGTILKSAWFKTVESAFAKTVNDTVTLIVSKAQSITGNFSLGNDVILKWDSPGNILTVNAGITVSNIGNVEAGDYQIFAGSGEFDFVDGTLLNLSWFNHIRSAISWIDSDRVTLVISGENLVDYDTTVPFNVTTDFDLKSGRLSISGGVTLTISGPINSKPRQIFTGSGTVSFSNNNNVSVVYPQWWGALADAGVTDSTNEIQDALDTGKDVYFIGVDDPTTDYYKISSAVSVYSYQTIKGDGYDSIVRQTTNNSNIFEASSKTHVVFDGVHAWGDNTANAYGNGNGIYFWNCSKCEVKNCYLSYIGNNGISLNYTNDSKVLNNWILSVYEPKQGTSDITLRYTCLRNIVKGNHCLGGGQVGIRLQAINITDQMNDNIVENNIITTHSRYGITLYNKNQAADVRHNSIRGNWIYDITGSAEDDTPLGNLPYGTGIYNHAAEYTIIEGNQVDTTNTSTDTISLTQGGIAGSGNNAIIKNNYIRNASYWGIQWEDSTGDMDAEGRVVIEGNNITNVTKDGIYIKDLGNIVIAHNTIENTTLRSMYVYESGSGSPNTLDNVNISNNICRNSSHAGIIIDSSGSGLIISGNLVETIVYGGISIDEFSDFTISGNVVKDGTNRGIKVGSTASDGILANNIVTGCDDGITVDAATKLIGNKSYSNTTDWVGAYGPVRTFTGGDATPSVKDGEMFLTAGTTNITDFDDGVVGQTITIRAMANITVVDGVSVILNGGANYDMTITDTLTLTMYSDTYWTEISRSVN